jgi:hypothetical protein
MSQVYPPTRAGKIAMFREQRANAANVGDRGMVHCMNVELDRLGAFETTQDATETEHAVPEKPRRGRKPLPRCEHETIAERCELCNPELAA